MRSVDDVALGNRPGSAGPESRSPSQERLPSSSHDSVSAPTRVSTSLWPFLALWKTSGFGTSGSSATSLSCSLRYEKSSHRCDRRSPPGKRPGSTLPTMRNALRPAKGKRPGRSISSTIGCRAGLPAPRPGNRPEPAIRQGGENPYSGGKYDESKTNIQDLISLFVSLMKRPFSDQPGAKGVRRRGAAYFLAVGSRPKSPPSSQVDASRSLERGDGVHHRPSARTISLP